MSNNKKPLGITDVILRDAHQSLFATRMRTDDMLPIAEKLDKIGFWSVESWDTIPRRRPMGAHSSAKSGDA